jgi:hypothetical protein
VLALSKKSLISVDTERTQGNAPVAAFPGGGNGLDQASLD